MPFISVVVPTYNRERFVVKAVDSILGQSFTDCEVIVIDDGSTDGTGKRLQEYGSKIRYLRQDNSGVSAARNTGIEAARGKWVSFLDSDDEWTRDYLSTQVSHIEQYPLAIAHITNAVTVVPGEGRSSHFVETRLLDRFRHNSSLIFDRPLHTIVAHVPWFLQSTIMRRDTLLEAGPLDKDLCPGSEDLDIIARVALRGPFTFCKRELVEVYRREEAIECLTAQSLKRGIERRKSFGKVYANLLRAAGLTANERAALSSALSSTQRALGNVLVMEGLKAEARQAYKDSLFVSPSLKSLIRLGATFLPGDASRVLVRRSSSHIH